MDSQTQAPQQDIFSQLAAQNSGSPTPQPQPQPQQGPQQPQQAPQQGTGPGPQQQDIFSQLAAQNASGSTQTAQPSTSTSSPVSTVPDALHMEDDAGITPGDNAVTRVGKGALDFAKRANAVGAGIGDGILSTLNGGASILHLPHGTLQQRQHELEQSNAENPTLNGLGYGGESFMEFLMGDGALKGLALSDRLLKSARIAKVLEGSPRVMRALQIGAESMRGGAVQGADAYVKSGGDGRQALEQGAIAAGLTGVLGIGGETVSAIRAALDDSGVQPALRDGIRAILSDAAKKANVAEPTAASIRDAASEVADNLKSKAQSLYKTLDTATGGQAQRYRDAAENVRQQLQEIVGLDDEKEAALTKRQAEIDAAHQKMLADLAAKGHDPAMLSRADATWKQMSALNDLSTAIRQSATGLRPELAAGAKGATTPEALNAKTLFRSVNRLNDKGRLAQAIGRDNADALLRHVDEALLASERFADRHKVAAAAVKAAATAGLGGLGYGAVHLAHSVLGSN